MSHSPLEGAIAAEIVRSGPMPFSRFMELALYEPEHGYYTGDGLRVGRDGDFVTSPSASPTFGHVLGRLVGLCRQLLGRPETMRLVDCGADDGRLLDSVLARADPEGLEVVAVERGVDRRRSAASRLRRHRVALTMCGDTRELESLPPTPGLVLANELFDALPVRRLRRGRGATIEEAFVTVRDDRLVETWRACDTFDSWLPRDRECAVAVGVATLIAQLASAIERGLILIIDYGYPASILFAADGAGNPVRGFRRGTIEDDLLARPGEIDLTAHVDFSAVDRAARSAGLDRVFFCDQTYLLIALGFLDEPEASAARRLIHPEDMGGSFKALLLSKGLDLDGEAASDVRRRLEVRDRGSLLEIDVVSPAEERRRQLAESNGS